MELRVAHLRKSYNGREVLRDVSFTAGPGITCVMAPSGGGKTTLLRILLGLERADGGTISGLEGCRVSALFQEDRLLMERTALENLSFVLGSAYRREECAALLAELGLEAEEKPVRDFSGGMRRRVALARALAPPGELLVLDEPFNGLDEQTKAHTAKVILKHWQGAILAVTHLQEEAELLGAKIHKINQQSAV